MSNHEVSRRTLLGAGAAATAATAIGGSSVASAGEPVGRPSEPDSPTGFTTESLATLQQGEQVIFFTAAGLVPNDIAEGASSTYNSAVRGVRPASAGGGGLSASVNVPLGSRITGIEFVMVGASLAGSVTFYKYLAETAGHSETLYTHALVGSGVQVFASGALNEVFDGTQTYEAYFYSNGGATYCKGIRVRYMPQSFGLIPITPARVYDSRFSMVPDANGPISSGASRTISVAAARNPLTGVRTGDIVVPASATAIAFTVTVAGTVDGGYLAVNPGGVTAVTASSINWSSTGQLLANTGVVKLNDSRQITIVQGGGATDFIIDIVGYYA